MTDQLKIQRGKTFLSQFLDLGIYVIGQSHVTESDMAMATQEGNPNSEIAVFAQQQDEVHKGLLENILGAVNLDINQVAVIWVQDDRPTADEMVRGKTKIISFGVANAGNQKFDTGAKYVQSTIGDTSIVFAHRLSELALNRGLKKRLWKCLQDLF